MLAINRDLDKLEHGFRVLVKWIRARERIESSIKDWVEENKKFSSESDSGNEKRQARGYGLESEANTSAESHCLPHRWFTR